MEVMCAGKYAKNPRLYYLKCPVNNTHPGSFKWFDDVLRHPNAVNSKPVVRKGKTFRGGRIQPDGWSASNITTRRLDDVKTNILTCFTGMLLVMLGVVIGMQMKF